MLYSRNTNISGNVIKQNLRTSINEQTHFFTKIYLSHFILESVDVSVVCERWAGRRILRERTSSHIFYREPGDANGDELIGCVSLARLRFSALCLNLTAWFSSRGLLPVTHLFYQSALITLSSSYLLIKM